MASESAVDNGGERLLVVVGKQIDVASFCLPILFGEALQNSNSKVNNTDTLLWASYGNLALFVSCHLIITTIL